LYVFRWVCVIIASVLSIFGGTCCVLSKIFYDKMIESIFPSEEKISKMIEEIAESYCQSKLESKKKEELFKKLNKQLDEFENYVNGQSK
jgi:hypothetical protein